MPCRLLLALLSVAACVACGATEPAPPVGPRPVDPAGSWAGTVIATKMTLTLVNANGAISGTSDMDGTRYTAVGTFDSTAHLRLVLTSPTAGVRGFDAPAVQTTSMAGTVAFGVGTNIGTSWPVVLTRQ